MFDFIVNLFLKKGEIKECAELSGMSRKMFACEQNKKLCIILFPWRGNEFWFRLFIKRHRVEDISCLLYKFPSSILSSMVENTRASFEEMAADIRSDITEIAKQKGFKEIEMIGISLSCVTALMVANNNPLITKVTLIVPGNSLAESLWHGTQTQHIKKDLEQRNVGLKHLSASWGKIAPENNIAQLEEKEIYIALSKSDTVIPYRFGKKLVETLQKRGYEPKLWINKYLGHYLTIFSFLVFRKCFKVTNAKDETKLS